MYEYGCTVTRVVDGDTIDVILDLGFSIFHKCRVRLYGIDTPESRTRDKDEKARGKIASKFLKDAIADDAILAATRSSYAPIPPNGLSGKASCRVLAGNAYIVLFAAIIEDPLTKLKTKIVSILICFIPQHLPIFSIF